MLVVIDDNSARQLTFIFCPSCSDSPATEVISGDFQLLPPHAGFLAVGRFPPGALTATASSAVCMLVSAEPPTVQADLLAAGAGGLHDYSHGSSGSPLFCQDLSSLVSSTLAAATCTAAVACSANSNASDSSSRSSSPTPIKKSRTAQEAAAQFSAEFCSSMGYGPTAALCESVGDEQWVEENVRALFKDTYLAHRQLNKSTVFTAAQLPNNTMLAAALSQNNHAMVSLILQWRKRCQGMLRHCSLADTMCAHVFIADRCRGSALSASRDSAAHEEKF